MLSDWLVDAQVQERVSVVLRFGTRETRGLATGMNSEALPPLRAPQDGEDLPARSLACLAHGRQSGRRATLLSPDVKTETCAFEPC